MLVVFVFSTYVSAAPEWVVSTVEILKNGNESERQKAAYSLSGYYTDNGANGDITILNQNLELLSERLKDQNIKVRQYITEIVGARTIEQYPKPSYIFIDSVDASTRKRFIRLIESNLNEQNDQLALTSAEALINIKQCKHTEGIINRFKKSKGNTAYEFKFLHKKISKICA